MSEPRLALRSDDISWTPTDTGTVVILDLRTSEYLQLNDSAAVLWSRLSNGAQQADLVADLVKTYSITEDTARADVESFLAGLRAMDLLAESV